MEGRPPSDIETAAREQLKLVLSFFPRAEATIGIVLGVDLGVLALLAARLPSTHPPSPLTWIAVLPTIPCAASLVHLYRAAFPRLVGGRASLVYFREIASRGEAAFVSAFLRQKDGDHARDLLEQAWRNAQILTNKYQSLKKSFQWLAGTIAPWLLALVIFRLYGL